MHIANRHEALVMSADHTTLRSQASTAGHGTAAQAQLGNREQDPVGVGLVDGGLHGAARPVMQGKRRPHQAQAIAVVGVAVDHELMRGAGCGRADRSGERHFERAVHVTTDEAHDLRVRRDDGRQDVVPP